MRRELIAVVGNQGCGKSVWTKAFCAMQKRLLVSDPLASYPAVDFMADPQDWLPRVFSGEIREFRFGTYYPEELPLFGHAAYGAGDCTFVIEECALMFRKGGDLDEWAKKIIYMGRHQRVNVILVAQRAVNIPLAVRSQATRIVSFRQIDPDDARELRDVIGESADELQALPDLQCIDWEAGKGVSRYSVTP
jgi:hypothetical protein